MTSLGEAARWRKFVGVLDVEVPEPDGDDLAGFVGGDWARLVASTGEFLALEANPGVDLARGVLGPWPSLGRRIGDSHMGGGC